jgi:hypothetical protein
MYLITKRPPLLVAILLATVLIVSLGIIAAVESQSGQSPPKHEVPWAESKQQVFELRVYTAAPGKLESLNKRFREHTLRLFEKHGIKSVGYWTAVDEDHQGRLYYIIAYPDRESRQKMLVNGIAKDPEFLEAVAKSEKDGKLTAGVESVLMVPTDYSPIK